MSYSDIQTFKSRFWKHGWELYPENLRDLLKEGNPVGHVNFKLYVALGNHDYHGNVQAQIDINNPYWNMPAKVYSFDIPNHTFVVLSWEI